jgi:hypothetical protein
MPWVIVLMASALVFVAAKSASADGTWADELTNSLKAYQANYPDSNWNPYIQKMTVVREAANRGDSRIVRTEMGKWFKMLRNRDHGIHDVAADELHNFAVMITPLQEYGIAVPSAGGAQ